MRSKKGGASFVEGRKQALRELREEDSQEIRGSVHRKKDLGRGDAACDVRTDMKKVRVGTAQVVVDRTKGGGPRRENECGGRVDKVGGSEKKR